MTGVTAQSHAKTLVSVSRSNMCQSSYITGVELAVAVSFKKKKKKKPQSFGCVDESVTSTEYT